MVDSLLSAKNDGDSLGLLLKPLRVPNIAIGFISVLTVNLCRHTESTFGLIWNHLFIASAGGQRKKLKGQSTNIQTVVALTS